VLEAKRLQSFPDDFVIHGAWGEAMRQLGNAVPVQLAEVIGKQLSRILSKPILDDSTQEPFDLEQIPSSILSL
jgi:site-specific DNA-cytosine methylase